MWSTLASSSSWHVLCRRGTLDLPRWPPPPGAPHTQPPGVLPAVHSRMDWLADAPGLQPLPGCPGALHASGGGSRLSAPGSVSTTRWRVAQPRRCRVNAAGSGGLDEGREERQHVATGALQAIAGVIFFCAAPDALPMAHPAGCSWPPALAVQCTHLNCAALRRSQPMPDRLKSILSWSR